MNELLDRENNEEHGMQSDKNVENEEHNKNEVGEGEVESVGSTDTVDNNKDNPLDEMNKMEDTIDEGWQFNNLKQNLQ